MEKDDANCILGSLDCMLHFDMPNTSSCPQELGTTAEAARFPEKVKMGSILLEALSSQVLNSSLSHSVQEKRFPETFHFPERTSNLALLQMLEGIGVERGEGLPSSFNDDGQSTQEPQKPWPQQGFQELLALPLINKLPDSSAFGLVARDEFLQSDYDLNMNVSCTQRKPNYFLQREFQQLFEPESCITHASESCSQMKTEPKDQYSSLEAPEEGASSALNQEPNSSNTANSSQNCNDIKFNATSQLSSGGGPEVVYERRKRKRSKACKNSEEVESQRMTHIAVERNRRKQMNEHLNVLRSLMPSSFIQRGDQASIIGGAIDFVKELEQLLQSLQAQKRRRQSEEGSYSPASSIPFNGFFLSPQYTSYSSQWSNSKYAVENYLDPANELTAETKSAVADVEVTMIETHASLKILSQKRPGQLLKTIAALENLDMTILHLNITTIDRSVLYSFNVKIEDECQLTSADEIATAVHEIFRMIHSNIIK
eukprot:Gb_17233 [translate_table: standard]